ncbi:hypothetical protein F8M41_003818 [Gigaspora margarita]|uniref:Uncharacterized protein n=1 Tax=Gigaspora margarita TaxID=4874 RepID=A0A8H4AXU9_GIGMA|nr:hypothetical protein F8M41_003818 [Gigaspora margarita]
MVCFITYVTFSDEQNITLKRKSSVDQEKNLDYYVASNAIGDHIARCHYCPKYWICGCPGEMEDHLVNICPGVPIEIKKYCKNHFQINLSIISEQKLETKNN